MEDLGGQVIIITGASAGIGKTTALSLAREGATVVLAARRQDRLEAIKREIETSGGAALAVTADITSAGDRERLVEQTLETYGRVDALINNAGYGRRGPIEMIPIEEIRANFETNFFSLIALTQLVVPVMRKQGSGRIVNIGSVAGRIARPLSSVYDATKHALEAITDGLRGELAPFGVKVVMIEPGFIITEFLEVANEVSRPTIENAGPYAPFLAEFSHGYERARRLAGKPEDIADVIKRALTAPKPRARYSAPSHAKLFLALKRFLPERLFDSILYRQMGLTRVAIDRSARARQSHTTAR
jgi:short-subunit dehydrogenase